MRFKNYGVAPKSAADFAFLLHGFHYLIDLAATHNQLMSVEQKIQTATRKHNEFLAELGLPVIPFIDSDER